MQLLPDSIGLKMNLNRNVFTLHRRRRHGNFRRLGFATVDERKNFDIVVKNSKIFLESSNFTMSLRVLITINPMAKRNQRLNKPSEYMRTCKASGDDAYLALLAVRKTPQTIHETSPAQRLFDRRTKSTLPVSEKLLQPKMNPKVNERIRKRQETQKKHHNRGAKELSTPRQVQPTRGNEKKWKRGKIPRQVGIRSYEVESNGHTYIRNRKFLKPSKATTFSDNNNSDEEEPDGPGAESAVPSPPTLKTNENDAHQSLLANEHIPDQRRDERNERCDCETRSGRVAKQPNRLGINT